MLSTTTWDRITNQTPPSLSKTFPPTPRSLKVSFLESLFTNAIQATYLGNPPFLTDGTNTITLRLQTADLIIFPPSPFTSPRKSK
jgi:hypothetical protein